MVQALQIIFGILFLISLSGSTLSLIKGPAFVQTPGERISKNLDNVYRYMAGAYLGTGIICLWMAITMDEQRFLVYLIALTVFLAGLGRIISIIKSGLPDKRFYIYILAELGLPPVIVLLQYFRNS